MEALFLATRAITHGHKRTSTPHPSAPLFFNASPHEVGINAPSEARGKLMPPWIVPMAGAAHTSGGSHPHSGGKTRPVAGRPRPFTDGGVGLSSTKVRESRTTAPHCRRRKYSAPAAVKAVVDTFVAGASVSARGPTVVQRDTMPGYTRPTSSGGGGSCRICRRLQNIP